MELALQKPYLMHAINGVSADHLCYLLPAAQHPVQHGQSQLAAFYHWQKALQLFRDELSNGATEENMDGLISTVMLICVHQFMLSEPLPDPSKSFIYAPPEARRERLAWLTIQHGINALRSQLGDVIWNSIWRPVFLDSAIFQRVPNYVTSKAGDEAHSLFLEICEVTAESSCDTNPYYEALQHLLYIRRLRPSVTTFNKLVEFVAVIEGEFLRLLVSRDTRALLILAHWLAMMSEVGQWWISVRCKAECIAITTFLMHDRDERVRELLRYPARTVGIGLMRRDEGCHSLAAVFALSSVSLKAKYVFGDTDIIDVRPVDIFTNPLEMASTTRPTPVLPPDPVPARTTLSPFELLITCNPPILRSLLAQIPTETIFRLYQTSPYLRDFFARSPTSWRYISWRLYQPATTTTTITASGTIGQRQSSNYALDQIILTVINPFSTRLASLELDNTAVSGTTLTSTVLILRRETLLHVSVRGCKNVSLKYHINPWLTMHALARNTPDSKGPPPGFETLALKSLYTYRCRHHRRRPYLPSSLARKESDSEPTHELVTTCHTLGIWTDTAWCTTPGARCYRRRGYVKMRMPQDPREVWVVYDRLWRSRNWLGPVETPKGSNLPSKKRKRDCRSWEYDEEGMNGEPLGTGPEAKFTPAHLRHSHRQFVDDITCQNCDAQILESCAFDRPYLRNRNSREEDRNKFWWAPGCAVSPCSMQDQDLPPLGGSNLGQLANTNSLPNLKFKWCCTEPLFSGGGGITYSNNAARDIDRIRAAPLPRGHGWEDPEFNPDRSAGPENVPNQLGPGGRWQSIDGLFQTAATLATGEHPAVSVPRVLCDDCYNANHWKIKCKACATAICLKHDISDRLKARICGYKDLVLEKQEYKSKQTAAKLLATLMKQRKGKQPAQERNPIEIESTVSTPRAARAATMPASTVAPLAVSEVVADTPEPLRSAEASIASRPLRTPMAEVDRPQRSASPVSDSTGPHSRSTSPAPSAHSIPATPEPNSAPRRPPRPAIPSGPKWRGCQALFCPATRSAPGDHRRRCTAPIDQCVGCKVYICDDCSGSLEPPCPCKGCQRPPADEDHSMATMPAATPAPGTALFFCPNCRWDRMISGKCKRKSEAFLKAQSQSIRRLKKRKDKMRKPVEERRTSQGATGTLSATEQAIEGLVEFFTSLNMQYPGTAGPQQAEASSSSQPESATQSDVLSNNPDEIRELEDMGALARDLIRRIQRLRDQFRPGSLAAQALPDIRVEDGVHAANTAAQRLAHEALAVQMAADIVGPHHAVRLAPIPAASENANAPASVQAQNYDLRQLILPDEPDPDVAPDVEELDDEDDGQFEDGGTSTE
ncbi:hypothetical protein A1O7_01630 [Cladophialophora yegresii CBS 114405]|uniref:Uncharacterized protein n=1 Tax=Cladophialophora yegresii CBS 114405 TaxID=1182544 RepID=W9X486_9EURO|nr:uncharacterized protein A1O7_01630 [Cladophialophora yegresii CBS 114405]EXJ65289.1 hypothetical protein A1O7_01630 [Cladophialophora yegresii CBS 114405]